jgi:hypothetical protein
MALADYITDQPPSASLGDLSTMFVPEQLSSPIDMYKKRVREILAYGNPNTLSGSPMIGRLLAINLVSATEAYFRSVLSAAIELCPIAQSIASEKNINLGGMLWHGRKGYSRSAFDHISFANADDLKKASSGYVGFVLQPNTFKTPLDEFDKVCHLRHGLVHNDGILPGRNAVKLEIKKYDSQIRTIVDYGGLQDIASVTSTLVSTFNRELFDLFCKRWAVDWRNRFDWNPANENNLFNSLWSIFVCRADLELRSDRHSARRIDCLQAVRVQFGLG